jgi:hypothetical protein
MPGGSISFLRPGDENHGNSNDQDDQADRVVTTDAPSA